MTGPLPGGRDNAPFTWFQIVQIAVFLGMAFGLYASVKADLGSQQAKIDVLMAREVSMENKVDRWIELQLEDERRAANRSERATPPKQ